MYFSCAHTCNLNIHVMMCVVFYSAQTKTLFSTCHHTYQYFSDFPYFYSLAYSHIAPVFSFLFIFCYYCSNVAHLSILSYGEVYFISLYKLWFMSVCYVQWTQRASTLNLRAHKTIKERKETFLRAKTFFLFFFFF